MIEPPDSDWTFIVKRYESPLTLEMVTSGLRRAFIKERLGLDFGHDTYRIINDVIAYPTRDLERARKDLEELYAEKGVVRKVKS